jgi:hypothetical protein
MPEQYTWVDWQLGKRARWQRVRLAELPYPPAVDDKVTMQRFASPIPQEGEPHKASFVLDFDAHAAWLSVELCRMEALRFLTAWERCWSVPAHALSIHFSGRAGFHVTIPGLLFGDVASPHLTAAYRRWATDIKDALALITLDAPSRQEPEWWYSQIAHTIGRLPPEVHDRAAFALSLRRVGIYTRRRMIRRENSQHPHSGLYKIALLPSELAGSTEAIRHLATQPRALMPRLAPPTHPALATHLQHLLMQVTMQEQHKHIDAGAGHGRALIPDVPLPIDARAPLCVQRMLARPAPDGSSNMPLITLLAYWRASGVELADAIGRATSWLLHGVNDPAKQEERRDSAHSVAHAVYTHHYRFAHRFIAPLHLVTDAECALCPLRAPCWRGDR